MISSIKNTFVESPNTRKVTLVNILKSVRGLINGMETQGFPSVNHPQHSAAQDQ